MTTRALSRPIAPLFGDAAIAGLAWASASAGLILGGKPLWVALVALALPMLAFLAFGHLAGRGAVMACIASALGVGIASGSAPWGAVALIGLIDVAALAGGRTAERMAPARAERADAGTWMTIVVQHEATGAATSPRRAPVVAAPMDRSRRTPRARRPLPLDRTA